jgi:glyoxylase-like metal-dependent hydrolase (beta-lactamase superfamily II)
MKIAKGVEMLEVPAVSSAGLARMIYPTLLWEGEDALLVDAGYPGQLSNLRQAVDQSGVAFERIGSVILTHHDIDHLGGLRELQKQLPRAARVLAHEVEKAYIQGDITPLKLAQLEADLPNLPAERKGDFARLKALFENSYVPVDETLSDGQLLPFLGGVRVIHTPGHTLGHICLYLPESKTLVGGDMLAVADGKLEMSPAAINYDLEMSRKSLAKLAPYEIEQVICYHSGLYRGDASRALAGLAKGA